MNDVYEVLHYMQKKLVCPKNQYNSFGKYKYRSCEDILDGIKKILPDGASVVLSDEMVLIGNRFYIKATAKLMYKNNHVCNDSYAREEENKKGMDGSQITGTASSYARKYALNGLFAIDDTKDADATNNHNEKDETISKEQLKELSALFAKAKPDFDGFMKYFSTQNHKVEELKDLQASQYLSVKNMLTKKIQQAEINSAEGKTNENT